MIMGSGPGFNLKRLTKALLYVKVKHYETHSVITLFDAGVFL
jgi:hypothetical protein